MESTGEAERIQVSASTAALLRAGGRHALERRGTITAKGKGELETFWLLPPPPESAVAAAQAAAEEGGGACEPAAAEVAAGEGGGGGGGGGGSGRGAEELC
jgi:hypothetical protein